MPSEDSNNDYQVDKNKNDGKCSYTVTRKWNTDDNQDFAFSCDGTADNRRNVEWEWAGNDLTAEFMMHNKGPKDFELSYNGDCSAIYAGAKLLAVSVASTLTAASLYL